MQLLLVDPLEETVKQLDTMTSLLTRSSRIFAQSDRPDAEKARWMPALSEARARASDLRSRIHKDPEQMMANLAEAWRDRELGAGAAPEPLPAPAMTEPLVVMLSIPFGLIGGFWLVYWLGFNLSVAVAVGFIALAGVAAEIGVLVLTFIDHEVARCRKEKAETARLTASDIMQAVHKGTSERVRPIVMTATAIIGGLLPIMWGSGTGSSVMQRIAAPMVGGMLTVTVLSLLVLPVIYGLVLQWRER